jgi:hypothetical protein
MSKKAWKRAADGIWKNKSGTYYERPKIDGSWTYRSLKTKRLADAKTEFHYRRGGGGNGQNHSPPPAPAPVPVAVAPVAPSTQPSQPVVFQLYKRGIAAGMRFKVEVIDTWNMTITPVPGEFVAKKKGNYDFVDAQGRSVPLPGKPHIALRIVNVGGTTNRPDPNAFIDPNN